jgi:hypothetical protein
MKTMDRKALKIIKKDLEDFQILCKTNPEEAKAQAKKRLIAIGMVNKDGSLTDNYKNASNNELEK